MFNEFENFKPWEKEPIQPLNLYVVSQGRHALKTQSRAFKYGKFLKPDDEILAVKKPSFIRDVDYQKASDELYSSVISENKDEDVYIKKLVANVQIGLLEKCLNKASKGMLFDTKDSLFTQCSRSDNKNVSQYVSRIWS